MSEPFAYFGGIDFSGAKEPLQNLWTAVGREAGGKLEIVSVRPHAFRADLGSFVASDWRAAVGAEAGAPILWGAAFPLGLPAVAADHLLGRSARWSEVLAWVADRPPDEIRNAVPDELRKPRITDAGLAPSPLDVRSYKQALEGIRWLHELREEADLSVRPQAGQDSTTTLIEVSPSATVQELGLPRRRAPGRAGETRARAAALRTFLRFSQAETEAITVTLEDAWEAVISCLTAYLARGDLEQPRRVAAGTLERVQREGWIYRAPASIP